MNGNEGCGLVIFSAMQRIMSVKEGRGALNARLASYELQQQRAEREETMREIAQLHRRRRPPEDERRESGSRLG
jgi:hypothetical protein